MLQGAVFAGSFPVDRQRTGADFLNLAAVYLDYPVQDFTGFKQINFKPHIRYLIDALTQDNTGGTDRKDIIADIAVVRTVLTVLPVDKLFQFRYGQADNITCF